MSSFPILDLVVGIIFIYFLLSIICSSAVELWFSMLKTRAKLLEQWLKRIFDLPALDSNGAPVLNQSGGPVSVGQEIMDHCMVTALSKTGKSTSYIDAENFVSALLDKITLSPATSGTNNVQLPPSNLAEYITSIKASTLISGELKRTILSLAYEALQSASAISAIPAAANITNNITATIKSELDHFRDRLEKWYDTNADRLTGTFKRIKVLPATIVMAIIITVGINADSVQISKYLYDHKEISKQLAEQAMNSLGRYKDRIEKMKKTADTTKLDDSTAVKQLNKNTVQLKEDIENMNTSLSGLPIGWKDGKINLVDSPNHILGWLATILAICLGAPFWFDILSKIANLRGVGPKPSSSSNADTKNN